MWTCVVKLAPLASNIFFCGDRSGPSRVCATSNSKVHGRLRIFSCRKDVRPGAPAGLGMPRRIRWLAYTPASPRPAWVFWMRCRPVPTHTTGRDQAPAFTSLYTPLGLCPRSCRKDVGQGHRTGQPALLPSERGLKHSTRRWATYLFGDESPATWRGWPTMCPDTSLLPPCTSSQTNLQNAALPWEARSRCGNSDQAPGHTG